MNKVSTKEMKFYTKLNRSTQCLGLTSLLNFKRCKNKINKKYPYCNHHKFQPLYFLIFVFLIPALIKVSIPKTEKNENLEKRIQLSEERSFSENSIFNILILPLLPDKDCTIENTEYEKLVSRRLIDIKDSHNLDFDVKISTKHTCPNSIIQLEEIALKEKADFIIYGFYDEDCDEPTKVLLKYFLNKKIEFSLPLDTNDEYKTVPDLQAFRNGEIQKEIEYIIHFCIGYFLSQNDYNNKALNFLESYNIEECDSTIQYLKGYLRLKGPNRKRSLKIFKKLHDCYPGSRRFNYLLGTAHFHTGNLVEANNIYNSILKKDSLFFEGRRDAMHISIVTKNFNQAQEHFDFFQRNKMINETILCLLGKMYLEKSDFEKGKEIFRNLININPNHKDAYTNLIKLFLIEKDTIGAKQSIKGYFKSDSLNEGVIEAKLGLHLLTLEFQEGEKLLRKGLKIHPNNKYLQEVKTKVYTD